MEITFKELEALAPENVLLLDMRSEESRRYGTIPGAKGIEAFITTEELIDQIPQEERGKKIVIFCARGQYSLDAAIALCEAGYDAASLQSGYYAWLGEQMKRQQASDLQQQVEESIRKRFRRRIWSNFTRAIREYELVKEGDRIAVCISGGKDSMLLAECMCHLKKYSDFHFDVEYIVMDPGYVGDNRAKIIENAEIMKLPIKIFDSPIFETVYAAEGGSPCYLCARMRRGYLYKFAQELGCNKIALGHHFDDAIETTLMSMLYGAEIKTMMPKLKSTNYEGMELIRPLYMVREKDIISWASYNGLEFIRCACKVTQANAEAENGSKRQEVKNLIKKLKAENDNVDMNIFKSIHNVNLATVIGYRECDGGELHMFTEGY